MSDESGKDWSRKEKAETPNLNTIQLIYGQINRILMARAQGYDDIGNTLIMDLLKMVSRDLRFEVEDRHEEYTSDNSRWEPKISMGWSLSADPYNPIVTNERDSLDYDPHYMVTRYEERENKELGEKIWVKIQERGGAHWLSPERVEDRGQVDHNVLFQLILSGLETRKIWWPRKNNRFKERTED